MTDEKIIKAIKACVEIEDCSQCPYKNNNLLDTSCFSKLFNEILVFINSQKVEIEKLKEKNESLDTLVLSYGDYVTKARAEAIKEFAERLKPMYKILCVDEGDWCYELDNLVKEMVVEDESRN